jgi:predicted dehydrogenase
MAAADEAGLRVGSAPDTFLGGSHQACRRLVDDGLLGTAVGATAFFMCPGHESWHPNPAFYYEQGGGPMLDMGPYYVTDLVNLLGPVRRVTGIATMPRHERLVTSQPLSGTRIAVDVPTHVNGVLEFESGVVAQIGMSFDVVAHRHGPLEIYGTEGTLVVPDPNHFGGEVHYVERGGDWQRLDVETPYSAGDHRGLGVADLALALRHDRPHRASGALALHVLEVMEAVGTASSTGQHVEITTRVERPAPLAANIVDGVLV